MAPTQGVKVQLATRLASAVSENTLYWLIESDKFRYTLLTMRATPGGVAFFVFDDFLAHPAERSKTGSDASGNQWK